MLRTRRLDRANIVGHAVARQAELIDRAVFQQTGVRGSMRRVTSRAAFGLDGRVFVSKRPLLVDVALDARCIGAGRQACLLCLKTAVRVVTITATHRAFQNFVMERHRELRLNLVVTTRAQLRVVRLQHANSRKAGLLGIRRGHEHVRAGNVAAFLVRVRRVTIGAADIVAPMLSATEVVALFFSRMATQTSLRRFLRSFVLERNDLRRIAFGNMVLARAMTRFAAGRFIFPAAHCRQLRVRGV